MLAELYRDHPTAATRRRPHRPNSAPKGNMYISILIISLGNQGWQPLAKKSQTTTGPYTFRDKTRRPVFLPFFPDKKGGQVNLYPKRNATPKPVVAGRASNNFFFASSKK